MGAAVHRVRVVPDGQRSATSKTEYTMLQRSRGRGWRTPRLHVMVIQVLLLLLERDSGSSLVGRSSGRLLRERHDSRTRNITRLLLLLVMMMEMFLEEQLVLLLLLLIHSSKCNGFSGGLATALWSASRLGCRVATGQCLGWMLETILARSSAITFNMRSLAAGTCGDGRQHHRRLVKVGRDGGGDQRGRGRRGGGLGRRCRRRG